MKPNDLKHLNFKIMGMYIMLEIGLDRQKFLTYSITSIFWTWPYLYFPNKLLASVWKVLII